MISLASVAVLLSASYLASGSHVGGDVPVCWRTANTVPSSVEVNGVQVHPNQLLTEMSGSVCAETCQPLPHLMRSYQRVSTDIHRMGDCETSVLLSADLEAFLYRGGNTTVERCHYFISTIVNDCVRNGPNSGISMGSADSELYEAGFREPAKYAKVLHADSEEFSREAETFPQASVVLERAVPAEGDQMPLAEAVNQPKIVQRTLQNVVKPPPQHQGSSFCDGVRANGPLW